MVENYRNLIKAKSWVKAIQYYQNKIDSKLTKASDFRTIVDLLLPLFPNNVNESPYLVNSPKLSVYANYALGKAFARIGKFKNSIQLHERNLELEQENGQDIDLTLMLYFEALLGEGEFAAAYNALELAYTVAKKRKNAERLFEVMGQLFHYFALTGQWGKGERIQAETHLFEGVLDTVPKKDGFATAIVSLINLQREFWGYIPNDINLSEENIDNNASARLERINNAINSLNDIAATFPSYLHIKVDYYKAIHELETNEPDVAEVYIQNAMGRANFTTPKASLLAFYSKVLLKQNRTQEAISTINSATSLGEDCSLIERADLYNNLASISLELGDIKRAEQYAQDAYQISWASGKLHSYHYGLKSASKLLQEIGCDIPVISETKTPYTIPHEAKLAAWIDGIPEAPMPTPETPTDTQSNNFLIKDVCWFQLGVIACFDVKEDDEKDKMTELAKEFYSLCDESGPILPSTGDELVDPHPDMSFIENRIERKLIEEMEFAYLNEAEQHDTICIAFIVASTIDDKRTYFYMSIRSERLPEFYQKIQTDEAIKPTDYGRIVWGESETPPTQEDRDSMFDNWLFCEDFLPLKLIDRKAGG